MCWIKKLLTQFSVWFVGPVAMLLLALGSAVLLLASPVVWSCVYEAPPTLPVVSQQDGELIARHLWTDKSYFEVSRELKAGRLTLREVDHYEDLQKKFVQLCYLVVVCSVCSLLALLSRHGRRIVLVSLAWLVVIAVVGLVWSYFDWRHMFRTLHWWIFQNDSWILPWGCYSLRLFPYSVWKISMALLLVWGCGLYGCAWFFATILQKFRQKRLVG